MKSISEQVMELEEQGYEVICYITERNPCDSLTTEWEYRDTINNQWIKCINGSPWSGGIIYRRKKEEGFKCGVCGHNSVYSAGSQVFEARCMGCRTGVSNKKTMKEAINSLMSLRKVVLCKDCKHRGMICTTDSRVSCSHRDQEVDLLDYCSQGEEICTHRYVYPNSICIDCGRLIEGVTFIKSDQIQEEQETDNG